MTITEFLGRPPRLPRGVEAMRWFEGKLYSTRGHTPTDPACVWHRPPRTRWQRWWFHRGRGRGCLICALGASIAGFIASNGPAWADRMDDARGPNPRG